MFKVVNQKVMLDDLPYRIGKKLVLTYIPASSAAYFSLSGVWGLPATTQVVGTLAVLATFIGAVLGVSSKSYDESGAAHDGEAVVSVDPETGVKQFSLNLNGNPMNLDQKDSVSFKVVSQSPQANAPVDDSPILPDDGPKPPS